MHACDAAVHSRARENSPGTRVRGGEQGSASVASSVHGPASL